MAIAQGVAPHRAFINGVPIEHGTVTQNATRKVSKCNVVVPMDLAGQISGSIQVTVSNVAGTGTIFTGEARIVHYDFINRLITVNGEDPSYQLHHNKTSESWVNQTGTSIVQDLVGRIGVPFAGGAAAAIMAGTKVKDDFVKMSDNVTFGYIVHKMAEMEGARFGVDPHGTFQYLPMNSSLGGGYSINYVPPTPGSPMVSDALHLVVIMNLTAAQTGTQGLSHNPHDQQVYQGQGNGGGRFTAKYHIPARDQEHIQQYMQARQDEISRHALTVQATVVGDPNINPFGSLSLSGTGLDGSFNIDQVVHSFGMRGYTMSITARTPAQEAIDNSQWSSTSVFDTPSNSPPVTPSAPTSLPTGPGLP